MRTVNASFDFHDEVTAAVDGLTDMGIASSNIDVVTLRRGLVSDVATAAGIGSAVGILAGIGAFAISGEGLSAGLMWLVPVALGIGAGGLCGGLIGWLNAGPGDPGRVDPALEASHTGATLVAARVHDDEVAEALALLRQCGAMDVAAGRARYAADGWDGFGAQDIWEDDIGREEAGEFGWPAASPRASDASLVRHASFR
ncbi:hypothetical protein [Mesorhizobium marinum]|uniref:hypothetical protein n=1 Tax=Mesorhizobium marinum TaxID=3228790 RepID=UPI0034665181